MNCIVHFLMFEHITQQQEASWGRDLKEHLCTALNHITWAMNTLKCRRRNNNGMFICGVFTLSRFITGYNPKSSAEELNTSKLHYICGVRVLKYRFLGVDNFNLWVQVFILYCLVGQTSSFIKSKLHISQYWNSSTRL